MPNESIPADYNKMDLLEAKRFDKKVKENFMPAIISIVFILETLYNLKDT